MPSPILNKNAKRQAVGALITDPKGRVLMVRGRWRREWAYPGGFVDSGEQHLEAVAREKKKKLTSISRRNALNICPPKG